MSDLKLQLEAIQDVYTNIILEGVTPKYKTGDKVGIGITHDGDPMNYSPVDTGTVTKIEKSGIHHVTFDNKLDRSSYFPADHKPLVTKFGADGTSLLQKSFRITNIENHQNKVNDVEANSKRRTDLDAVVAHVSALKNGHGNYPKLSKDHVATIKALLDKHTEE
jgi:hypothetical protein